MGHALRLDRLLVALQGAGRHGAVRHLLAVDLELVLQLVGDQQARRRAVELPRARTVGEVVGVVERLLGDAPHDLRAQAAGARGRALGDRLWWQELAALDPLERERDLEASLVRELAERHASRHPQLVGRRHVRPARQLRHLRSTGSRRSC